MALKVDEQVNKVNVLTERVRKRKEAYLAAEVHACADRSRLATESWKETEEQPLAIRRAKLFKKILEGIPIAIHEGELIVGGQTQYVRGANLDIEMCSYDDIRQMLQSGKPIVKSPTQVATLTEDAKQSILQDLDYWQPRSSVTVVYDTLRRLWGNTHDDWLEARVVNEQMQSPTGRTGNWGKVLNEGLSAIISEAREKISNLKLKAFDNGQLDKFYFWEAVIIACEAVINYAKRYADLAREMAAEEKDETRRAELERIAETCDWVPANPARNFYEALQSFFISFLANNLEVASKAEAPGLFDQYMYPFLRKDIEAGRITYQEAAELLGLLLVKWLEFDDFGTGERRTRSQGSQLMNVAIAGVTEDGRDAVNELSFLFLEAVRQVKSHQPHVSVRYHDGIDLEFMIKAVETNRDHGGGIPAFFNDKAALAVITQKNVPIREARSWGPQGCVEMVPYPNAVLVTSGPFYNLNKILEITLHNGVDPRTGKKVGLTTGDPRDFTSFEELCEAFKKQTDWVVDKLIDIYNVWFVIRQNNYAMPYSSALVDGCIESGKDMLAGGARWGKEYLANIRPFGHQNLVNSLAAIKKLVYEERVSMDELLDALTANFEGRENLQHMLLAAPKWGNDDDYVDSIMRDLFRWTEDLAKSRDNPWGGKWNVSRQGLTLHYVFGQVVGALPDGRKAWEALADGSVSAMRGTDMKGPTAVLNSAAKIDQLGSEATLLNLKFDPGSLQSREGINKFISLIKTYFDNYGYHCQFNILSQKTLLDAKAHPERYRDLVVRVAGFSAFFVDLAPEVQDEIIARTEHSI